MSLYRINLAIDSAEFAVKRNHRGIGPRDMVADPLIIAAATALIATTAWIVHRETQSTRQFDTLLGEVAVAIRDSTQLDEDIYLASNLRQRQALIAERMAILHEIDTGRYTWAHLMDEFALAAPPDLWLLKGREIAPTGQGQHITFELTGYAPGPETVSDFMRALEASAFVTNVTLSSTEKKTIADQPVMEFVIRAATEEPDPSLLEVEYIGAHTPEPSSREPQSAVSPTGSSEAIPMLPPEAQVPSPAGL